MKELLIGVVLYVVGMVAVVLLMMAYITLTHPAPSLGF
jgi:hypothetical protein